MQFAIEPLLLVVTLYIIILLSHGFNKFRYGNVLLFLCAFLFCLFPVYDGDYYHYKEIYERVLSGKPSHLEAFYIFLIENTSSYLMFRAIVWGTALLIFYKTISNYSLSPSLTFYMFCCMYIPVFAYARVSLAMSVVFMGISCFIVPKTRRITSYLCGTTLIVISLLFHKTVALIFPVLIIALILKYLPRYTCVILCLFLPLVSYILGNTILPTILGIQYNDYTEMAVNSMTGYMESEQSSLGIGYFLKKSLEYISYYLTTLISIFLIVRRRYDNSLPDYLLPLAYFVFAVTYVATIFLLNDVGNTFTIFYRLLNFLIIPASILLYTCRKYNLFPKLVKSNVCIGIMAMIYWMLYSIYCYI